MARTEAQKVRRLELRKQHEVKLKMEVLTHYGGGKLACVRCGFSDVRALCLDHINSNSAHPIRNRKGERPLPSLWSPRKLRARLKRLGFPEGFQTLCANCNLVKAVENGENKRTD